MEPSVDSLSDFLASLSFALGRVVDGIVWALGGKFMPSSCAWCRPAWMIGLVMGVIVIFVYSKGPKSD